MGVGRVGPREFQTSCTFNRGRSSEVISKLQVEEKNEVAENFIREALEEEEIKTVIKSSKNLTHKKWMQHSEIKIC